ncbi:N-formylglutamate amidohydrolase [Erythrobacter sp. HA6-11]
MAERREPFTLFPPTGEEIPVLIAVPHAGRAYSAELLAQMRAPELVMNRLEDRYVDEIAYEAAQGLGASLLIANAPRAMLDLNRSRDDVDWSMVKGARQRPARHSLANRRARSGLGLIPRRLPGHGEIWRTPLSNDELEHRIDTVHRPYHQTLGKELARIRDRWGAALLIDLHSMPPLRPHSGAERGAEFVVGDRFSASCDPALVAAGQNFLEGQGRIVTHNRPYSGGYVLNAHGMPRQAIHALQLEVCRSIYLDADLNLPTDRVKDVAQLVAGFTRLLGEEVARLGNSGFLAQAAE